MKSFFQYLSREIMTIGIIGLFGYNAATGRVPGPEEFARYLQEGRILAPVIEMGEGSPYYEEKEVAALTMVGRPLNIGALAGAGRYGGVHSASRGSRGVSYIASRSQPIFLD